MEALEPGDPQRVGPYRLEGRLGAGGMGQVFLGMSPGGRRVAVKVIRPELAAAPQFRERFAREVDAARRVGGFHTAQVVDADPQAASPWLVTAFVPGLTLHQTVAEKGPLAADAVLRLGAGLAEGLAAIHRCGLVHRDLKPGNVILADDGPRIIDFGIALALDASALTTVGTVIGTYAFMSPEQISADRAGPASDVFSLGSVLAFAATGRSPFDAPALVQAIPRILNEPPALDGLDGELLRLLTACLVKDPDGRPSVDDLLARFAGLPAGDAGAPAPAPGTEQAPPEADAGEARPSSGQGGTLHLADAGQPMHMLPTATHVPAYPPRPPNPPSSSPSPSPDSSPGGMSRRTLLIGGLAAATAVAGVGTALVVRERGNDSDNSASGSGSGSGNGAGPSAGIPADGLTLKGPDSVQALVFGKDSKTLLAAGGDGTIRKWDVSAEQGESIRIGVPAYLQPAMFTADLKRLIRADKNKVQVWDVTSGRVVRTFDGPPGGKGQEGFVQSLALSPDGKTLVGSMPEGLYTWDLGSGKRLGIQKGQFSGPLAFSPDAELLVTAFPLKLRDFPSLKAVATIDSEFNSSQTSTFSPDSQILAIAERNGPVRLWNVATRQNVVTLKGHKDSVVSLAFQPGGSALASGSEDGTVRLWDTVTGKTTATFDCGGKVAAVVFSPDGNTLAAGLSQVDSASAEDTVRIWRVPT
uniref:Serine/threonine protein kinase n=1 Tax=Streptomyces sp. NBC_01401 TaxID=2903854 RepID=A0AAU3GY66_9ACTN